MDYNSYKNARDASWQLLLDSKISELPVNISPILRLLNITVRKDLTVNFKVGERGYSVFENDSYQIVVPDIPGPQKRYTILHEVGHIVMRHIQDDPKYEYEAERFAIDVLAPACVLWGMNIRKADDIAMLCNISLTSARIRAERMELLYKREQAFLQKYGRSCFLQSPLEQQVYMQFKKFIEENK